MSTGAALRAGGWDPVLLVSQMMLLQTAHYLSLSFLTPFAAHGVPSVDLVLDWRELAGWTIDDHVHGGGAVYASGKMINVVHLMQGGGVAQEDRALPSPVGLAVCWLLASLVDVWAIYLFVRRPRLVLDFALTLLGFHLIISTYYSGAVPKGLLTWGTYAACAAVTIVVGEQVCVRREMQEGIQIAGSQSPPLEDVELGLLDRDTDRNRTASG
ncbi:integral membrane protein S linking to the trans Golgi network-domain-containing protein [Auriculariales sp. MPI-PUGE-AT-0066]|nr:integral membrane protein S linking to the trans Golgi network-domain-containing protein [Auriculariales sp. MPI-PUGE-AT-0066]